MPTKPKGYIYANIGHIFKDMQNNVPLLNTLGTSIKKSWLFSAVSAYESSIGHPWSYRTQKVQCLGKCMVGGILQLHIAQAIFKKFSNIV